MYKPQYYTIVSGVGKSNYSLVAFDNALRNANIGDYNLVKVSSILPANCKYCDHICLEKGSIVFAAYSNITVKSDEIGQTGVAVAIPTDTNESGVIFECSSYENENVSEMVQDMCREAMANRNKSIDSIKHLSQKVSGENGRFVSSISAIVMW